MEKINPLYRTFDLDRRDIDEEKRTVDLAFSSEEAVERWFGNEILDHKSGSVRLGRLNNSGPLLVSHDSRDHVGVVESVEIGGDRKGRARVRFGSSARADEIFKDVKDGIRSMVSVGYRIYELILESQKDGEPDTYRAIDWEPFEISIVSVPADITVGVGRADDVKTNQCIFNRGESEMPDPTPTPAQDPAPAIDVGAVRKEAATAERERCAKLFKLGRENKQLKVAQRFVNDNRSVADMELLLETIRQLAPAAPNQPPGHIDLDLGTGEKEFSIVRAIRASMDKDWSGAGYEREISVEIAGKLGRSSEGFFVPTSLAVRAPLAAGVATGAGHTVATQTMPMIELLRNRMMVRSLGARVLSGLDGDLSFPRQDGTGVLYWVGENPGSDVTENNPTVDQVLMSPKTAQATQAYSRQLMAQGSVDVENWVRDDLMAINALGLDSAAINGTGASNQPTGIRNQTGVGLHPLGTNGDLPTWSDIIALETLVAAGNADIGTMAYLTNSRGRGKLKDTEKAANTAQFIWTDGNEVGFGSMNGYRAGASNQVPANLTKGSGSNLSGMVFGNWNDLLIAEWGVMEIIVDPYALKKKGAIEVTSIMLVDIAVRHPQSFAIIEDMITV